MANEKDEKVVEAKAEPTEQKKEQKSVTFALGTLSVILSLCSLGIWFLCRMLLGFGAGLGMVATNIFFIIAFGLGVFAGVLAWINAKQKFTLPLAFAAFVTLVSCLGFVIE